MSIYRKSCRVTERVMMKKMYAVGQSIDQISTKLRVDETIVTEVVEGKWDSKEKKMALLAMQKNQEALAGKADAESNKIAQIAAAAAAAISGQSPVVDPVALRAKIEAEVRAEIAGELVPTTELSPQQRGAATRKANAAQAESEAQDKIDDEQLAG